MAKKMTAQEIDDYLDSKPGWIALTTLSADGFPHTVPLGYFRLERDIVMGVLDNTTKVHNIERDARVSLMVESGSNMSDIRGVMIQGLASIHRDPQAVLHLLREGAKRRSVPQAELPSKAKSGAAFIRVTPSRIISWDYGKAG